MKNGLEHKHSEGMALEEAAMNGMAKLSRRSLSGLWGKTILHIS